MHVGVTEGPGLARPFLELDNGLRGGRREGAVSADGKAAGCYLHGLFAADAFRAAFLGRLKARAAPGRASDAQVGRSEGRRVGKEGVRTFRSWGSPIH